MKRRVVVTGMGVVSPLGVGLKSHLDGLAEGRSGITAMRRVDTSDLSIKIGAEAAFEGDAHFNRSEIALRDRVTQMALVAGAEAVAMAELDLTEAESPRFGAILGSSMGGMETCDDNFAALYREGKPRVHPFTVPRLMANAPASHLSMRFGLRGPSWVVSTACASSNHAMGQAFQMVRSGALDGALTGGAEAGLTFGVLKAWEGLRVMSKEACRPFCRTRNGMVQGEGAAVLAIETLERAKARGATILCELVGFGASADAGDIVMPSQDGAARAMAAALDDAGLAGAEVGYVNAHGTATAANDKTETAAIRQVFGEAAGQLSVSSTKSMHGHSIGAAGAVEFAAMVLALRDGVIAPTINHQEDDPECDLDITPNTARERVTEAALSNSFAFGGLNAVLAAKAWRGA
ncbi:MAG: beta-ketoacyl-[acyl-carrier-protein] synthase family protein [Pseudomonadota bacterium]